MDQNNKKETPEKNNQEKHVPNQQNNQAEKNPQRDLKPNEQNPQNQNNKDASRRGDEKDADETLTNPTRGQKPSSDQVKHVQ